MEEKGLIHKKIIQVMAEIGSIGKEQRNASQGYSFRGVDDIYQALHPLLAKHGIFTVPKVLAERSEERTTPKGTVLIYRVLTIRYRFYAEDGSFVDSVAIGEGMDSGDKASNKAMSAAHKYVFLQVFCIPTKEAKDSEIDDHEVLGKKAPPKSSDYQASDPQKFYLKKIFADYQITDEKKMIALSKKLMGTPMNQLAQAVKKEIGL